MNIAQPIRDLEELRRFKHYYTDIEPNMRNHVLLTLGLNTALRISDLLTLRWEDVYDFAGNGIKNHIILVEQKTKKNTNIYVNDNIRQELMAYQRYCGGCQNIDPKQYLFPGREDMPVSRSQAWRIIRKAAEYCNISGVISPHSLRKTFGYHAWKQGTPPTLLMDVFNHSSFEVTRRYLGIGQDDRDEVFRNVCI